MRVSGWPAVSGRRAWWLDIIDGAMGIGWLTPEFAGKGLVLAFFVALIWLLYRAHPRLPKLRRIPGFQVFDEAIGRCAELGRPVLFTTG
ncbi:MAG: DUF6754 domain-containing protein, partial [bacterium]